MSLSLFHRFSSSRFSPGFLGGFCFSKILRFREVGDDRLCVVGEIDGSPFGLSHGRLKQALPLVTDEFLIGSRYCGSSSAASPPQGITKALESETESSRGEDDSADVNWDELGFELVPTDYMYVMKTSGDGKFSTGEISRYGNIELSPSSGVLNYGLGMFEGLKAYRKHSGGLTLFRPEQNALRMQNGAERLCMSAPSIDQFVEAVKQTAIANKRWVPPTGKGALYLRPLLLGSGAVLGLAPAPEYMFMIYASPVGNYFESPINLFIEDEFHRATRGGAGAVKTIGNYALVLKAQLRAKRRGFSDVLFLDSVNKRNLEEAASSNVFIVKGNIVSTPSTEGTILPGITRKSIIEIARDHGYEVVERSIPVEELLEADEAFCTGTAVVVAPVGSITYRDKRIEYRTGAGTVSQTLYRRLTSIQMGLVKDIKGWTVEIE